jgi:cell division protein FtsL
MPANNEKKHRDLASILKGEVLVWLVSLIVAIIGIMTPIINLNTTITELNDTIQNLNKLVDKTVLEVNDINNRLIVVETQINMKK